MAAVTVDAWMDQLDRALDMVGSWPRGRRLSVKAIVAAGVVGAAGIAPGFPLAFGAVAPGPRSDLLPSSRVRVPPYWTQMASYLNRPGSPAGNLLVLPPDPFYQMLYTWGYYGNDGFITDMVRRNVLDPAGQGYGAAGGALTGAVNQIATSLLAGDDLAANRLLSALGTPVILVREDLSVHGPVEESDSPEALAAALASDPGVEQVRRFGLLALYRLRDNAAVAPAVHGDVSYATSETAAPDLLALSVLPPGTAIIRHAPIAGVPDVVAVPSEGTWSLVGRRLQETVPMPSGRSYRLVQLGTARTARAEAPLRVGSPAALGPVRVLVSASQSGAFATLSTRVGPNELSDGNFAAGQWQTTVGNCNAVPDVPAEVGARLAPAPAGASGASLLLSASADIACESRAVSWRGGPVLLTLTARDISGPTPAVCLWEIGPDTCANLPAFGTAAGWQTYQQVVVPPSGTQGLSVFLYADSGAGGVRGTSAFAAVGVRSISVSPPLAIVATARGRSPHPPSLTTADSTFSSAWTVRAPAQHVLVDGVANGWLSDASGPLAPRDTTAPLLAAGLVLAVAGAGATLVLAATVSISALWALRACRVRERRRAAHG